MARSFTIWEAEKLPGGPQVEIVVAGDSFMLEISGKEGQSCPRVRDSAASRASPSRTSTWIPPKQDFVLIQPIPYLFQSHMKSLHTNCVGSISSTLVDGFSLHSRRREKGVSEFTIEQQGEMLAEELV
jgi:hypothetical protein